MEQPYISIQHFRRYLTSQPFFIWHSLKAVNESLQNDDDSGETFWSSEAVSEMPKSMAAVIARTFKLFDAFLFARLQEKGKVSVISGTVEQRIAKTNALLGSNTILLNPVFIYKGAIATPFAFDCKNGHIINIKYSKKTRLNDIVTGYFDYCVISRTTEVNDYILYLPEEKKGQYEKGEISLVWTNRCHRQSGGFTPGTLELKTNSPKDRPFMDFFNTLIIKQTSKDIVMLPTIDLAIETIDIARGISTYDRDLLENDVTSFGTNPEWLNLLAKVAPNFANMNYNLIKKGAIARNEIPESKVYQKLKSINEATLLADQITQITMIKNATRVIWYDFEGFSLPFAPLNSVDPYQQVVFQVSLIETKKGKETKKVNLVVDPKNINEEDLLLIIETVYQSGADKYVVYNQGYENSRLSEIVTLLKQNKSENSERAEAMVNHIKGNTVDLYDIFRINSSKKLPKVLLHDQKGKTSIKNVEKHITTNFIKLPRMIIPYQSLKVASGIAAMDVAIKRALGIIGDNEWDSQKKHLEKYCENDVRAMIMVYDFVEFLVSRQNPQSHLQSK